MKKNEKKGKKWLQFGKNCIIIEAHPNIVKRITIELVPDAPSGQSDLFVFNDGQVKEMDRKNISNEEKKGKIMCKKLEELSELKVEDLYDLFEEEFVTPPININRILDKLGVEYNAMDFSLLDDEINGIVLPEQADMVMGAVAAHSASENEKDSVEITVNINDSYHRQRFTLAHELAHCMLHANSLKNGYVELRTSQTSTIPREREANILAGEILIPEKLLKIAYKEFPIAILEILAEKFDVSNNVMAARLQHLKMGYYTYG